MADFKSTVSTNFRDGWIDWMVEVDRRTRSEIKDIYCDKKFDDLCSRISGNICDFNYEYNHDGSICDLYCFEVIDNNFVIPYSLLET
jgi:hypothetical protein